MARGVAELSMPAVAREAGVSLRTVYRHFPTKRDLLAALAWYLDERMGYSLVPFPRDLDELATNIRQYFRALDGMDDTIRAAWSSQIAREAREVAGLAAKFEAIANGAGPAHRRRSTSGAGAAVQRRVDAVQSVHAATDEGRPRNHGRGGGRRA